MDGEVLNESEYADVLEVLPAEGGKSNAEVKAVTIAPFLSRYLYKHQIEGVQFMYDNLVVNVEQLRGGGESAAGNGCILAHCMGLGKTLQAVTIMHVLLTNDLIQEAATSLIKNARPLLDSAPWSSDAGAMSEDTSISSSSVSGNATVSSISGPGTPTSFLRTCLVLVPKNVLRNWEDELKKWLREYHRQGKVFVVDRGKLQERRAIMELWHKRGGILVMSYTVFRIMTCQTNDEGECLRELLLDPGPDVVVADEAHLLKNEEAKVTVAIKKLRTKRRVALTGSPLQNNLVEYYTMVDFVREGVLGDLDRFKSYFEYPILNGMLVDSSPQDVKKSHGRSHVLHETLRGFVQRKDVTFMARTLPSHVKKEEIVLTVALTKRQKRLTQKIFREAKQLDAKGLLMRVLTPLQLLWTHPEVYETDMKKKAARAAAKAAEESDITDDDSTMGGATRHSAHVTKVSEQSGSIEHSRKRLTNAPVEEKFGVGPTSKGGPWDSSICPGNVPPTAEAVAVGAVAATNASRRLNPIEDGSGSSGERNRFSPGYRSDFVSAVAVGAAAAINASRRLNPIENDGGGGGGRNRFLPGYRSDIIAAVAVGAAAAINASRRLHPFENDGGVGGGRNRFSPGYSSDYVANCRPEGMNVAPAVSTPMMLDSAANDLGSASMMPVLKVDLASHDLDSDVDSDRRERGGFAIGSGDCMPHGFDALESSPKRPKLGVEEEKEALVGRDDKASVGIRWQGISAGGRDVTGGSPECVGVGFDGGATYATTAASATAEAVDPATAPYRKKRQKRGVVGGRNGALTEKLRCLDDEIDIGESAKMVIAMEIIARAIHQGDKILVFSQRTLVLDFFERVFMTRGFGGTLKTSPPHSIYPGTSEWGPWENGKHYFRLDGSTSSAKRQAMIDEFNRPQNKLVRVFLLSTRAGNMGINLVAANRVILMDTSWNPANDLQAMFRCYRFGQTKPVEIYRLVMGRSLENKIHNRQITKHALAKRVVDARNPGRKLTMADQILDLNAEYSRYEDDSRKAGSAPLASVPLAVTEQDAQILPVDNERLADLLGIREAEERGASEGQEPLAASEGAPGIGNGEAYGFTPSQLLNPSFGPSLGAAESRPSSPLVCSSLMLPHTHLRLVGGRSGAEETEKARAKMQSREGEAAVEDPVLKHLLDVFHPQYIISWVANKHLLEDDPLEKLDDAGKVEAKRQYDEEVKLQEQIGRQLKCTGGLVQGQLRPGSHQRAALAALMKQQKQPQQQGLAQREMSQEGLHRLAQLQQRQEQLSGIGFIEQEQRNRLLEAQEQFTRNHFGGGEQEYQGQPGQELNKISQPLQSFPLIDLTSDYPRTLAASTASMARTLPDSFAGISTGVSSALTGMSNHSGDHAGPSSLQGGWGPIEPVMEKLESPWWSEKSAGLD